MLFYLKAQETFQANFTISIIAPEQVSIFKLFILISSPLHFKPFFLPFCFICKSLALMFPGEKIGDNKKVGMLYVCVCVYEVKRGAFEMGNFV